MPIIDLSPPDLVSRPETEFDSPRLQGITTPKGFAVTPGAEDVDKGSDAERSPGWGSIFGAAFRQDNTVGAALSAEYAPDFVEPGFNPWDAIKGGKYEPHWEAFVDARNPAAVDAKKRQIDQETEDRKTLQAAPWYQSVPAQMVAGVADLPTLIPGGAFYRGARGGFSVARSALSVGAAAGVATAAQETALQSLELTRPMSDTALNIGASVFLGGLLGAGGAKLLSNVEWSTGVRALERELAGEGAPVPGAAPASAGAAANVPAGIGENAIAGVMASGVAASTARLNPILRALQSPSAAWREVATDMVENSVYLKKNFEGVASAPAAETLMQEWNGGLAKAVRATNDAYPEYRKAGGQLGRDEFRQAVGRAMRRSDQDADPFIAQVAQEWRKAVFDPLKDAAIEAKLLPEDVSVSTAASYFSRMWNRQRLIAREGEFKDIVQRYYGGAIGKEYEKAVQNFSGRTARLDQEIADLQLPADARLRTLDQLEAEIKSLDVRAGDTVVEQADRLSDLNVEMRAARKAASDAEAARDTAGKAAAETRHAAAKTEADRIRQEGGKDLAGYLDERSALRARRRNVDLGVAGLQERSDKILGTLADVEEANQRAMDRLVKKGQKLERDLGRLDADALEDRVNQLADTYAGLARKSEAAAERAAKAIENIRAAGERGSARRSETAARATVEATTGPAEEAAAKRVEAKAAADETARRRAVADEAAAERLAKEAERQTARAERMDTVAQRLKAATDFDHDGLMAEIKAAIDKATRETSAASLARGERAARLGERMAALDPTKVEARVKIISEMKREQERAFFDRWETRTMGEGVSATPGERPDFSAAARSIADEAFNTLAGKTVEGDVRPEFLTVKSRGPMKDRTFNIPDELIENFLEHDVELVGRRYTRVMGADVELARKFGKPDMLEQIQKVRDDYARLRNGVTDEKQLTALGEREKADIHDLTSMRDLLRGTRIESPLEENYGRLTRFFNHVNYIRSMGEVVLASLTDAVRPAMVHGLGAYMGSVAQLATNMKAVKASVAEAQLAGNVAERVLGNRLATISEIVDPYTARGPVEKFLENMTNVASKWNGIRLWTDGMKSIASVMTQNRILQGAEGFAGIKRKEKAYLAYLGIDQSMAERIAAQFSAHGENIDGVRVANTEDWTDAVARRTYRAAINKDVDSIIVEKAVGDLPLFSSTPTGRMLLQFKSFALASHQKVLLRGLQEDQSRFVSGLIGMTALGMFITWAKGITGNRPEVHEKAMNNPGWWLGEGLDRAGVFAIPLEMANAFEKFTSLNPIKSPLKVFDSGNAMSQRNQNRSKIGSLLGPTIGMGDDVVTALGIPETIVKGEDVAQAQKNAATRLLPFNSYGGIRQVMNYLVNPPQ